MLTRFTNHKPLIFRLPFFSAKWLDRKNRFIYYQLAGRDHHCLRIVSVGCPCDDPRSWSHGCYSSMWHRTSQHVFLSHRSAVTKNFTLNSKLFVALYNLAPLGIRASIKIMSSRSVWSYINNDVHTLAWHVKNQKYDDLAEYFKARFQLQTPDFNTFTYWSFTVSPGCSYFLTMIDRFTRFAVA